MKLNPIYILAGEEELLKREKLDDLKKKCFPSALEASLTFNYILLNGASSVNISSEESVTSARVVNESQQLPFMAQRRMVVVKNAEYIIDEILLEYVKNPLNSTCLVLLVRNLDKKLHSYKILKQNTVIVEFGHLNSKKLTEWIQGYASQYGKVISYSNIIYIASLLENNLFSIQQELDKLFLYTGRRKTVTVNDIELCISENKIKDVFKLSSIIQREDMPSAIESADNLFGHGKNIEGIIGSIRWAFTRIWRGKDLIEKGKVSDISSKLHISYYFINNFIHQAQEFSFKKLRRGLDILLNVEKISRTYSLPKKNLLEYLIIQLCSMSGHGNSKERQLR